MYEVDARTYLSKLPYLIYDPQSTLNLASIPWITASTVVFIEDDYNINDDDGNYNGLNDDNNNGHDDYDNCYYDYYYNGHDDDDTYDDNYRVII